MMSERSVEKMKPCTFRLPAEMFKRGRELSDKTGVPMSRMVRDGLECVFGRYDPKRAAAQITK
jgi:predicted DNA-binding protein